MNKTNLQLKTRELLFSRNTAPAVVLLSSIFMESLALVAQHVFGLMPCANCVMARFYIMIAGLTAAAHLLYNSKFKDKDNHIFFLIQQVTLAFGLNYNYENYLIESGKKISLCGLESPFPKYFDLSDLLPAMFKPLGLCGTPIHIIQNITFTEIAIVGISLLMITVSAQYSVKIIKNK